MSSLTAVSKKRFGWIRALHHKKERAASGLTLLEGERLVVEALRGGIAIETVVGTEDFWSRRFDLVHQFASAGISLHKVSVQQMDMLATTEHTAGVLAVVARPAWPAETVWQKAESSDFFGLLAVGIQDPGNLGTLVRTMAAAGGSAVFVSRGSTEIGSPRILRASAGSVYTLPVLENSDSLETLGRLHEQGISSLAALPRKGRPYTALDLTKPTVLVLGGEGGGMPEAVTAACTQSIHIPMPGQVESLNVAAAGAVVIYEALRQKRLANALTRRRNP
ncbi:RNA methyltransferase [candidate division FCPU426 bacterium]|nr:RNA methyltransferase [candidate division FCPU426 bacterium]